MAAHASLLQPFTLKNVTLKNRIISTPHAPAYGDAGMPKERYQLYHEEKAKGGIAMTMFGGSASVAVDSPATPWKQLDVSTDEIIPYFRQFADRIHRHGAALMCQITHMGRRTRWDVDRWIVPISSSPVREIAHRSVPKEMEDHDFRRVADAYAAAAVRCKDGGLDGCEVLFASHLIFQFIAPRVNRRRDRYGGSLENRLRFGIEILEKVRAAVGDDYVVGMRMTGDELVRGGLSTDECVEIFARIAATGLVDFLSVIGAEVFTDMEMANYMPNMAYVPAPYLAFAAAVKKETKLPVFHASRIISLDDAARAVGDGIVDLVGMTRAHIADPHIVRKLSAGRTDDIRPCVGANYCIDRIYAGRDALCTHNAATGREATMPHNIEAAAARRTIVVAGGGPAGLEAARVSALRGHHVTLLEKSDRLGGQIRIAERATWRGPLGGIADWLEAQVRRLGVDVRLGHEATTATIVEHEADVVIIATGGRPSVQPPAVSTWDVLSGAIAPGAAALVYDEHGDHQAVSCAEFLARRGTRVELVTPARMVAAELGATNFSVHLRELYAAGVTLTTDHRLTEVRRAGDVIDAVLRNEYTGGEQARRVDQVVVERGTLPVDALYFELKPLSRNLGEVDMEALAAGRTQAIATNPGGRFQLFRIGDAVASRNIHAAIYDALRLCKDL